LVDDGKIRAVEINGNVAVAEEDIEDTSPLLSKRKELWARVRHLDGKPIGVREACEKYNLSPTSLYRWINRKYIRVLNDQRGGGRGIKRLLNEADVAYAAAVAKRRGQTQGRTIFTSEFAPIHVDL
jgi:predicted site-specific integrase-resolvase